MVGHTRTWALAHFIDLSSMYQPKSWARGMSQALSSALQCCSNTANAVSFAPKPSTHWRAWWSMRAALNISSCITVDLTRFHGQCEPLH